MSKLSLGIARVGDLLLENKITRMGNGVPLERIKLEIPQYQRPYKWTTKNADCLLQDILQAYNDKKAIYRVGTLILHQSPNNTFNIVDGQQRIITFILLLKALHVDINLLDLQPAANELTTKNINLNYNAFQRQLCSSNEMEYNSNSTENYRHLADYICHNCEMIVVITDDLSEAFQFFDSQNARGKALYPHDLLKAYHLREMHNESSEITEKAVADWEDINQNELKQLFGDYLYRLKQWLNGDWASRLSEHNLDMFKGFTRNSNQPFAQYYKGATAFAEQYNNSALSTVMGGQPLKTFLLETPVIAGRYFFNYTKHYHSVLADIRNNNRFEGFFINDNPIVKTLDRYYIRGVGNGITRLLFDTAVLLYVDRFCQSQPTQSALVILDQFVKYAFVWAYSLRAQYRNVGWLVAQNYLLAQPARNVKNAFNIYKDIHLASAPGELISLLAGKLQPLQIEDIKSKADFNRIDSQIDDGIYTNFLHYFSSYNYLILP